MCQAMELSEDDIVLNQERLVRGIQPDVRVDGRLGFNLVPLGTIETLVSQSVQSATTKFADQFRRNAAPRAFHILLILHEKKSKTRRERTPSTMVRWQAAVNQENDPESWGEWTARHGRSGSVVLPMSRARSEQYLAALLQGEEILPSIELDRREIYGPVEGYLFFFGPRLFPLLRRDMKLRELRDEFTHLPLSLGKRIDDDVHGQFARHVQQQMDNIFGLMRALTLSNEHNNPRAPLPLPVRR
ncbi:uncharacterized protein C8Q71DRAFT_859897 [Rhodofomes roseus]|uniref:Uncharacterized protein n=1 Tax=Rhodofomes roseus TaxID=34475 RepID=A0ABQ8KA75_9APHY|nr:uncharacterized protein C8Q71DRAFT_859897 [Rhodofomes roseus]KAH9834240.1 hypothetical protein C8Q71DRAFT_859897 [Rhodofomes roseus]